MAKRTDERPRFPEAESDVGKFIETRDGHAYPLGRRCSVKQIAYLYAYCRKHPLDIVAKYPAMLSHADVHTALAYYYRHQGAIDAEIKDDQKLNAPGVLAGDAGRLPRMGLSDLVSSNQEFALPNGREERHVQEERATFVAYPSKADPSSHLMGEVKRRINMRIIF
jgi:uncharacterized protein (DUF433 family)